MPDVAVYPMFDAVVAPLVDYLTRQDAVERVEAAGSYRRRTETIGDVDIVTVSTRPETVMDAVAAYDRVERVVSRGETRATVVLPSGISVDVRVVAPEREPETRERRRLEGQQAPEDGRAEGRDHGHAQAEREEREDAPPAPRAERPVRPQDDAVARNIRPLGPVLGAGWRGAFPRWPSGRESPPGRVVWSC